MPKQFFQTILCLSLFTLFAPLCQAEVYKWVDANGITHYSQRVPKGIDPDLIQIVKPSGTSGNKSGRAVKALKSTQKSFAERRTKQLEAKNEKKEEARVRLANQATCAKDKQKLTGLKNNPRQMATASNGERRRLSEEERQSMIGQLNTDIKKHCSG